MAEQQNDKHSMAQIADAINDILNDDGGGQEGMPEGANEGAPEGIQAAENEAIQAKKPEIADNLDAIIAAEFGKNSAGGGGDDADETDDWPPVLAADSAADSAPPALTFNAPHPPRNPSPMPSSGQKKRVRENSGLAHLSLQMQDTLAELRNYGTLGEASLLAEMQQAQEEMIAAARGEVDKLAIAFGTSRQLILDNLQQLERHTEQTRAELENLVTRFETMLQEIYKRHHDTLNGNQEQLTRYREFLLYLLDERD